VEAKSITSAAKRLHMSQPPLSQQIKLLEEEVGAQLIVRGNRHINLTVAGETLYFRAKSIVDFTENSFQEVQDIGNGNEGHLRLGMITSSGPLLMQNVIRTFTSKHPRILFDIYERNTYELIESMENKLIELAFVRTPFDDINVYNKIILKKEPLIAIGKSNFFSYKDGSSIAPDFFNNKPIIIYRRWKSILEKFFQNKAINPVYYCVADDARTSLAWALEGHGIAIIPESISHIINGVDIKSFVIDAPNLSSQVCAIWLTQKYTSPALKKFIDVLAEFEIMH
jgi:DNA-binding transcriptional LysR family regulator